VLKVAAGTGAIPYDMPGVKYGHVGELCRFDAFIRIHPLADPALDGLALIVRAPTPPGSTLRHSVRGCWRNPWVVGAVPRRSRGAAARHGMAMYDAYFAWIKLARGETHSWNGPS
jgi:hypothetical protein